MILVDSSILIEFFRKKDKTKTSFYHLSRKYQKLFISSITHYEIGIGNRKMHYKFWTELSKQLIVLPFDKECSNRAVEIFIDLSKSNKLIDNADILIGATAVTHNMPIATLNRKHFNRINKLHIEEIT